MIPELKMAVVDDDNDEEDVSVKTNVKAEAERLTNFKWTIRVSHFIFIYLFI